MTSDVQLDVRWLPGRVVVRAVGELDISNREVIASTLDALPSNADVVVDLREVPYVGIGALQAIQLAARRLREHDGRLDVQVAHRRVRGLAQLLGWRELAGAISEVRRSPRAP